MKYIAFCLCLILAACSSVKLVPDGKYRLTDVDIRMDDKGVSPVQLLPYIQQNANASTMGVRIYGLVKDDSNFIKRFIRKIGEAPVIFNPHLVNLSVQELAVEMKNQGYLQSSVTAEVDTARKKAKVSYLIHNGEPYRIRTFNSQPAQLLQADTVGGRGRRLAQNRPAGFNPTIREGAVFNLNLLEQERQRVATQMRNRGYYMFSADELKYLADTALQSNQVDLELILQDSTHLPTPYSIEKVNVFSGFDPLEAQTYAIRDSLNYNGLQIYYDSLHFLSPKVIAEKVRVRAGQRFRERAGESSVALFQALNSVGRVDMQYVENNYPDSTLLDCNIYLTPGNNHSLVAGLEGTNKAGDLGIAANINYGNLNLFNGSEIFNLQLRGAYELVVGNNAMLQNYYEWTISPSLTFPKMSFPFLSKYLSENFSSQTQYSLSYNIQRRPEYYRNFFNLNWKYIWTAQRKVLTQTWSIVDVNYVYTPWKSDDFQNYLNTQLDALTRYSYDNIFTAGMSYSLIYTNAERGRTRQNLYTFRFNAETSGNLLRGIATTFNVPSDNGQYQLLGNPFAQYVKGIVDFSETFSLDRRNTLAFHFSGGIAYPYENSNILPFEKRFFAGGPNHVRGWHTRYLGPGSFHQGQAGDPTTHVGDISLLGSAEYRYKALTWFEPAFFVDAGNIWTIKDYPDQAGGMFRFDRFYKEIALGSGVGLRIDLGFLIVRLDAGARVYDPAKTEGKRFVLFKEALYKSSALYLAIGYPF